MIEAKEEGEEEEETPDEKDDMDVDDSTQQQDATNEKNEKQDEGDTVLHEGAVGVKAFVLPDEASIKQLKLEKSKHLIKDLADQIVTMEATRKCKEWRCTCCAVSTGGGGKRGGCPQDIPLSLRCPSQKKTKNNNK